MLRTIMKRTLLAGLGLSLVGALVGCVDGGEGGGECLPGDMDCSDPTAGGKADGWNGQNDPRYFANNLQYKLSELPKRGNLETPVWKTRFPNAMSSVPVAWADTYWPSADGSHNHRWQGTTVKSPLEKYDAAFNNAPGCETQPSSMHGGEAKQQWDNYNECAGPAAKWQTSVYHGIGEMHDGIDNDGDGAVDDFGPDRSKGVDGIQRWWGTCHAWAPASLHSPEPQRAVTVNGVTFDVADIKALTQNIYDNTDAVMLGGRCNNEKIEHDVNGSANDECADVNPGSLHVIMTNFLGLRQAPLIEDRTANYEVWNQGVLGYEITQQRQVSNTAANECVGQTENVRKWSYNEDADKLYEVRMTVTYLTESGAEARPTGWESHTSQDDYHYILELNEQGKVIGGRYCTDNTNAHIDFLWSPTGSFSPTNPHVEKSKVLDLIKQSITAE